MSIRILYSLAISHFHVHVGTSPLGAKENKNHLFQPDPFPATSSEGEVPCFDEHDEPVEHRQK